MSTTTATLTAHAVASAAPTPGIADPRIERARPQVAQFLAITAQLALLLLVFKVFRVEQSGPTDSGFLLLCGLAFGSFLIHYWLPFRLKETFWVLVSVAAPFFFFELRIALILLAAGAAFYAVLSSPLKYWPRVWIVIGGFVLAAVICGYSVAADRVLGRFYIPTSFWPIFGSLFMFRMIIYAQDVRYLKKRPSLKEYLAYFFVLPNYYFQLFPVIDYKTMRLSYYRRNIHESAQEGIQWMCRGTTHLLLYEVVQYVRNAFIGTPHSLGSVAGFIVLTFLLYLRVSGHFHLIIGMLHLFGYDLPETNRKYLLSSSLTDFWRRINIYWKDFMVKTVYFPVYFRLRKKGDMRAKVLATGMVFFVTWALHAYQFFWLRAEFLFSWPDLLFWTVLGLLVIGNVLLEKPLSKSRQPKTWRMRIQQVTWVGGTMAVVMVLWSMWQSPTMNSWFNMLAYWRPR